MTDRFHRMARHWAHDRCRTLARQGLTDEQIAKDTGLPIINVIAYTREIREKEKR